MSDAAIVKYFEDRPIGFFTWGDRRAVLAREAGLALGYDRDGEQFVKNVTQEWADELNAGEEYEVVRGENLRELKRILKVTGESPVTFAPHLVILYVPEGLNLAALLSRKPRARELRRWLAREVMPQIQQTGAYMGPNVDVQAMINDAVERAMASRDARIATLEEAVRAAGRLLIAGPLLPREDLKRVGKTGSYPEPELRPGRRLALRTKILGVVRERPGLSANGVFVRVPAQRKRVLRAVRELLAEGLIRRTDDGGLVLAPPH